jgi:hypothetical protein
MSEQGQGLTFTKNMSQGFLFYSTPHSLMMVIEPKHVGAVLM